MNPHVAQLQEALNEAQFQADEGEHPVDVDLVDRALGAYTGAQVGPQRWLSVFDGALEETGFKPGVMRRLTAGVRSLHARGDASVLWSVEQDQPPGPFGFNGRQEHHLRVRALSTSGTWSERSWYAELLVMVETDDDEKLFFTPLEGRLEVSNSRGEANSFEGGIVAEWIAHAWRSHMARQQARRLLGKGRIEDGNPAFQKPRHDRLQTFKEHVDKLEQRATATE